MAWYETFFTGLPQVAWKNAQTDEQTQFDLELIVNTLDFGPGDRLLDVFCGYGRHALPLARMGAKLTGVDISAEYITELRATADVARLPLKTVQGDFMQLSVANIMPEGPFDAAYCLGNSFSFFPRPVMLAFLIRIANLLKPGGRFLAHSEMVAESVLPDFQHRTWQPVGHEAGEPILFLAENDYNPLESRIDTHLTYVHGGVTETRLAQHYVFTLSELSSLFREAGFSIVACYGTVDGELFTLGDEGVWMVAEKSLSLAATPPTNT